MSGGPVIAVERRGRHWKFEHAPSPWLASLGLQMTGADDWEQVRNALMAEMCSEGAVIVAGDVWHLPWQRGYQKWHAPHWFVLQEDETGFFIDERLNMMTPDGPQRPGCFYINLDSLIDYASSLQTVNEVFQLRESSIVGSDNLAWEARFRWLRRSPKSAHLKAAPSLSKRLEGPSACHALADYFESNAEEASTYEQADDLWQALRQRELIVGALEQDGELGGDEVLCHWRKALVEWKKIPVLLLHSKLRAGRGTSQPASILSTALRKVAEFEGQCLIESQVAINEFEWQS